MNTPTPYQLLGGESAVRSLVDRFYFYMDMLPETAGIRAMHGLSLAGARDKLFKFLSGWLGGPNLFIEEFGHPMLRRRHFPFAIGEAERDQWMLCMNQAMRDVIEDKALRDELTAALYKTADFMRNKTE